MTCKDIIKAYLEAHRFDGLFNSDGECACELADLFPCDGEGGTLACKPGYRAPCPSDCGEHDWHIQEKQPPSPLESMGLSGNLIVLSEAGKRALEGR